MLMCAYVQCVTLRQPCIHVINVQCVHISKRTKFSPYDLFEKKKNKYVFNILGLMNLLYMGIKKIILLDIFFPFALGKP